MLIIAFLVKGKVKIKHELEQVSGLSTTNLKSSCRVAPLTAIDTTDNIAYSMHALARDQ